MISRVCESNMILLQNQNALPQNAYYSLMTQTKQLLLLTFCKTIAGNGASFWTHGRRTDGGRTAEGQTDVEVEIVI